MTRPSSVDAAHVASLPGWLGENFGQSSLAFVGGVAIALCRLASAARGDELGRAPYHHVESCGTFRWRTWRTYGDLGLQAARTPRSCRAVCPCRSLERGSTPPRSRYSACYDLSSNHIMSLETLLRPLAPDAPLARPHPNPRQRLCDHLPRFQRQSSGRRSFSNKLPVLIDGRIVYCPAVLTGVYWDMADVRAAGRLIGSR